VRSGGHSTAGHGTVDGGLLLDLSRMKRISIDPATGIAGIEPGLTWGEVAQEAQRFGLALTSGDAGSVGVGGLALGGGIGWMARKYGLTIDNLLAVDLVTAEGKLVRASADENAELFWGLRGGGGNFGVATSFQVQMHPAGMVLGGAVIYPATETATLLKSIAQYAMGAPDELTTITVVMPAPPLPLIPPALHGTPVAIVMVCYTGDLEEGQRVVAPLRQLATPIADVIAPMPYPALFALTEAGGLPGMAHTIRSAFLPELRDEAFEVMAAHAATLPSPGSMVQMRILGGAVARVAPEATAFAHRDKPLMCTAVAAAPVEALAQHQEWTAAFGRAMRPYAEGVYVNFLEDEGAARLRDAYPAATMERLARLKSRFDPTNFFRLNGNILPADGEATSSDDEQAA
jgi:FAD/FMN-containing dehydrogenase